MTSHAIPAWTRKLLLSAAAVAFPASLIGATPTSAQGWSAEVKELTVRPPEAAPRKRTPAAAARAEARAKARAEKQRSQPAPVVLQAPTPQTPAAKALPVASTPAAAMASVSPAAGAAAAAARPAAPDALAAQDTVAATITTTAAADEELDDPFADVRIVQRPAAGDTLTTQVVPVEPRGTAAAPASPPPSATAAENGAAAQYCTNIVDAAIDARIAWQRQNLSEAEKELQKRTGELETRIAEYQRWLARRDQFAEKAKKTVVDIYTKMRPDAAAAQLQSLDEETAAAVLIKLDTRAASAVMNEMETTQAARLTAIISGAGKLPPKTRPPTGQGNRS